MSSEYITRTAENSYEVIFKTDDYVKYRLAEHFCRQMIEHLKPTEPRFRLSKRRQKRPKCPNRSSGCWDCVFARRLFDGDKFLGAVECTINAK